jgi:hypothetical protein
MGLETTKVGFDNRHWEYIYKALQIYKDLYGHLRVPVNYIIPDNSNEWPKELHKLKLGYRCKNIRYRGDFVKGPKNDKYRVLLEKIGFELYTNIASSNKSNKSSSNRNNKKNNNKLNQ